MVISHEIICDIHLKNDFLCIIVEGGNLRLPLCGLNLCMKPAFAGFIIKLFNHYEV